MHAVFSNLVRLFLNVAHAGSQNPGGFTLSNALDCDKVGDCIQNALNNIALLAIPIVAIMVLVGGFQIMFAGGNPEKASQGRKTVLYAVIGYAIILISTGVVSIIRSIL